MADPLFKTNKPNIMDNTPTKTAMMELIEWYEEISKDNVYTNRRAVLRKIKALLEKEKTQIVDAYVIPYSNIRNKEMAEKYYNETYKQ